MKLIKIKMLYKKQSGWAGDTEKLMDLATRLVF